jgi:hypothetical protein
MTMSSFAVPMGALLIAAAGGGALAQSASAPAAAAPKPIEFRHVAEALAALKARDGDGTIVTQSEGWTIINEPLASAQWSFVPSGHEAHPAVVRRIMRRAAGGAASVEMTSLCEAAREPCARLLTEFEGANDRLTQGARARARQGPTAPR